MINSYIHMFNSHIQAFLDEYPISWHKALKNVINNMLEESRYKNGDDLSRHNWGSRPKKLNGINIISDLLQALERADNARAIIELLWGCVQLGKRVHACIIIWFSVYIFKRPVLYIFRDLTIDKDQFKGDILGTKDHNFNIKFIKNIFNESFNKEMIDGNYHTELWKKFKLPDLLDINDNNNIDKLRNKDSMNCTDIFGSLMNHTSLTKINNVLTNYIINNNELNNITVIVDEGDLTSPTASNDQTSDKDSLDSTRREQLIAQIMKKVVYNLLITGTPISLLYNTSVILSDKYIRSEISRVHLMNDNKENYYGIVNNKVEYKIVNDWWLQPKKKYNLKKDYEYNIRDITKNIIERPLIEYNSLLINECKYKENHFYLLNRLIEDFKNLFIIIFHGGCLRLYLSTKYENEIFLTSREELKDISLYSEGGIHGNYIDEVGGIKLPNNYCYFDINTKKFKLAYIYRFLSHLFQRPKYIQSPDKTIITLSGKYADRGYSFTSDDYDCFSLHLTDQYLPFHGIHNSVNMDQNARLVGVYNDQSLKNNTKKLRLWSEESAINKLKNYISWTKNIQKNIMDAQCYAEIKKTVEQNIETEAKKYPDMIESLNKIDSRKKTKNINFKINDNYDNKKNAIKLTNKHTDKEIIEVVDRFNTININTDFQLDGFNNCFNEIIDTDEDNFREQFGRINSEFDCDDQLHECNNVEEYQRIIEEENKKIEEENKTGKKIKKIVNVITNKGKKDGFYETTTTGPKKIWKYEILRNDVEKLKAGKKGSNMGFHKDKEKKVGDRATRVYIGYKDVNDPTTIGILFRILRITHVKSGMPKNSEDYINGCPYIKLENGKIRYSTNSDNNDESKYFRGLNGYIYFLCEKPETMLINPIVRKYPEPISDTAPISDIEPINDTPTNINNVLLFTKLGLKEPSKPNIRIGISDIYIAYKEWCSKNRIIPLDKRTKLKEELLKLNITQEKSKGKTICGKPGARGYKYEIAE